MRTIPHLQQQGVDGKCRIGTFTKRTCRGNDGNNEWAGRLGKGEQKKGPMPETKLELSTADAAQSQYDAVVPEKRRRSKQDTKTRCFFVCNKKVGSAGENEVGLGE